MKKQFCFCSQFYCLARWQAAARQADQTATVPEKNAGGNGESDQELLLWFLQKPEIAAMLKTLAQAM